MRSVQSAIERCCGLQPVRAVTDPLSSIAFRKSYETVGLLVPAQASQAACPTSAILEWTRIVTVSPKSFMTASRQPGSPSAQLDCRFDLGCDPARQRTDTDRGPRMAASG